MIVEGKAGQVWTSNGWQYVLECDKGHLKFSPEPVVLLCDKCESVSQAVGSIINLDADTGYEPVTVSLADNAVLFVVNWEWLCDRSAIRAFTGSTTHGYVYPESSGTWAAFVTANGDFTYWIGTEDEAKKAFVTYLRGLYS